MIKRSNFTCPVCGSHEWGSGYNFDGPGDSPLDPGLFGSGKTTDYRGTWTRICHGRIGHQACTYSWNSRDDLAHGIPPPEGGSVAAQR